MNTQYLPKHSELKEFIVKSSPKSMRMLKKRENSGIINDVSNEPQRILKEQR